MGTAVRGGGNLVQQPIDKLLSSAPKWQGVTQVFRHDKHLRNEIWIEKSFRNVTKQADSGIGNSETESRPDILTVFLHGEGVLNQEQPKQGQNFDNDFN